MGEWIEGWRKRIGDLCYDLRWRLYLTRNAYRHYQSEREIARLLKTWARVDVAEGSAAHARIFLTQSRTHFESSTVQYVRNGTEMRMEAQRWLVEHGTGRVNVRLYAFIGKTTILFEDENLAFEFKLYWM